MEYRIGLEKQNKRNDQVTELILDNCRANQISGLTDEFVNLETLSLINVGLVTLKGFPKLPKLKKLELSDNRLTGGLNLLHGSPKLQHLNISGNRIKDFEALEPLREFHDLVNLDLYNCEVTKADDYRQKVFNLLPNLHSLDGYDRNEREVADSDESDDEGSDVENRITRDDNELDEEDEADDESSDYDEEEELNGMSYDEEANIDEELDSEDDVDEDIESGEDESYDDIRAPEGVASSSDGLTSGNEATNGAGEPSLGQLGTFENGDDDDVEEIGDDEEEEEDEDEGSDLKQLQREFGDEEDSDDDDFEPDQEPDERDHELDSEDDADADDLLPTSNTASGASAAATTAIETDTESKQRGQKRKHEDEGGDEVSG